MKQAWILMLLLFATTAFAQCPFSTEPRTWDPLHEKVAKALNYGVLCFGFGKQDCVARTGNEPFVSFKLLEDCTIYVHYIAAIDVMLVIGFLIFIFFRAPMPLVATAIVMLHFFVL